MRRRSQIERLSIAYSLLDSIWEEMTDGNVEDNMIQLAVYAQTDINRIVWKLNEMHEPDINPCRGCDDYDGNGGCASEGGCAGTDGD